ncbi:hypothetical protein GCM10028808_33100 [Spirosoma migulaei]
MARLMRLYSNLRNQVTQFRLKYTYWTLTDKSGAESLGIVGGQYGRYPFKRLYFGSQREIALKAHTYKGGSSIAQQLIQNRGLVVISETSIRNELKQVQHWYEKMPTPNLKTIQ